MPTVRTPHGQVAYEIHGSGGTPIVALPGIGDTRASYRALAPMLAAAGHTVYAMDLRGHGGSDAAFPSYTSEDIGDDVVALLEACDLRDAVVVGNSIGAAAGVHASLRSDRVGSLVLLSGFVSDPPGFALLSLVLRLMFVWPWGVALWGMYRKTLFATPPADADANTAELLANLREPGRLAAARGMMCASKAAIEARLSEVRVPALIAMGASDPDFSDPAEEAARQARLLGGDNRVVMIEGAGHYPQIEQPDATCRAILDHLGGADHGA
ncbi:MAG: alpha/beta hydrolase [Alphaproteobacteria bacterium]|nr:alpha/beta hydrolase [Alphaproteobacteria bacterium]